MKTFSILTIVLFAINLFAVTNELEAIIAANFHCWNTSRSGFLTQDEINDLIGNSQITNKYAAASLVLFEHIPKGTNGYNFEQALQLGQKKEVESDYNRFCEEIHNSSRVLFMADDPSLFSLTRVRLADCGLASGIASIVSRNPQSIRTMVSNKKEGIQVNFPSGRSVLVKPLTDAELLILHSGDENHGLCLSYLLKAYAAILASPKGSASGYDKQLRPKAVTIARVAWLHSLSVVEGLTGHKAYSLHFDSRTNSVAAAQLRKDLLAILSRRPMPVTLTSYPGHILSVLGYYPDKKAILVWDPTGKDFSPKGEPGITNGYVTHQGLFKVPLVDFITVFQGLAVETDQPAGH